MTIQIKAQTPNDSHFHVSNTTIECNNNATNQAALPVNVTLTLSECPRIGRHVKREEPVTLTHFLSFKYSLPLPPLLLFFFLPHLSRTPSHTSTFPVPSGSDVVGVPGYPPPSGTFFCPPLLGWNSEDPQMGRAV